MTGALFTHSVVNSGISQVMGPDCFATVMGFVGSVVFPAQSFILLSLYFLFVCTGLSPPCILAISFMC